ncbi:MAG: c-type cytochrome [Alphaproteobacteria bacterium]
MDRFEIIKIVGAFLMSVLIITVIAQVGNLLVEAEELEENVYPVAGTEEPAAAGEVAAEPGLEPTGPLEVAAELGLEPIAPLLTAASVESGKKLARKCAVCHTFKKGGPNKIGPNLWDIVGADKARWGNFSYSAALAGVGGSWGYEELNAFVAKPKAYIPGTKMIFNGFKEPEDRADLIAYLRTLSDSPRPLP